MEIVIDFNQLGQNPLQAAIWFAVHIGWLFPVFLFVYGLVLVWLNYVRNKYRADRKYILLAIDVPKENLQTPKAVENFFNHLAGAHQDVKPLQKWWDGEIPDSFTFEITSTGGYIQFFIHCVEKYRDLIEAILYAQYPDAEITQVEDYTKKWQLKFPNPRYQLWGTEVVQTNKKEYYPIRTYSEFEHGTSEEYKDTMAGMLEALTRIGPGEAVWMQFVVTPADNDWGDGSKAVIDKIIGRKGSGGPSTRVGKFADSVFSTVSSAVNPAPVAASGGSSDPPTQMLHLTPGERADVEAIQHKTGQIGFHTRIRLIYMAPKDRFKSNYGVNVVYGSFKQFNGGNGFKPDKYSYTGGIRFFKKTRVAWRRNKILARYKDRGHSLEPGYYGKVLTSEELATVWHFPNSESVRAPLLQKTEAKRAEPPSSLPLETGANPVQAATALKKATPKAEPPSNLPGA